MFDVENLKRVLMQGYRLTAKSGKILKNNIYSLFPKKKKLPTPAEVEEDIENNRNHSWIRETIGDNDLADDIFTDLESGLSKEEFKKKYHAFEREQMDYLVDNKISNLDFLYESFQTAKALKANDITDEDELFVMLDRTPELVYLCGAASILGLKVNLITEKFKKGQIEDSIVYRWDERLSKEEIEEGKALGLSPRGEDYEKFLISKGYEPKKPNKKIVFYQDVKADAIDDLMDDLPDVLFVETPFDRSAPNKETYYKYIYPYYHTSDDDSLNRENVISYEEFFDKKDQYKGTVENPSDLDTIFTITYSSGTTGDPKGILQSNRHYIYMGRYHAPEVSGIPNMGEMSTYSTIPAYSNSFISSILSDNMMTHGVIKLDPVDDIDYFKVGYMINDAVINIATIPSFMKMALSYYLHPEENAHLPKIKHQLVNMTVGEELLPCEKNFLLNFTKKLGLTRRFILNNGLEVILPSTVYGICSAGGTCEIGSAFIDLKNSGLKTYDFIDCMIINDDGKEAAPGEWGNLTVTSKIDFSGYYGNKEATEEAYITCPDGKKRFNVGVISRRNEDGVFEMKNRIYEDKISEQLDFRIADEVAKDSKNVASVKVVKGKDGNYYAFVIYNPMSKKDKYDIMSDIQLRVFAKYNVVVPVIEVNPEQYYDLTKSLKVDKDALIKQAAQLERPKVFQK